MYKWAFWGVLAALLAVFLLAMCSVNNVDELMAMVQSMSTPCLSIAAQHWVKHAYTASGRAEVYSNQAIQRCFHAASQRMSSALVGIEALAADLAPDPDQLQQLSAMLAETSAFTAAQATRLADIVSPSPVPKPQQQEETDTLLWVKGAYSAAGKAWLYHSQVVQAPLQQLTERYAASVQQLVSKAAAVKGLPADEGAGISAAVQSATQEILSRTSSILQPALESFDTLKQQPSQQPQQQEGFRWLQLAYAASGRFALFDSMTLGQRLTAASNSCQATMEQVIADATAEASMSPAVLSSVLPFIDTAVSDMRAGITAVLQQPQQPQESFVVKAAAIPAANSTQEAASNPVLPAHCQPLPLALLPVCSLYRPAAAAPDCDACQCPQMETVELLGALYGKLSDAAADLSVKLQVGDAAAVMDVGISAKSDARLPFHTCPGVLLRSFE